MPILKRKNKIITVIIESGGSGLPGRGVYTCMYEELETRGPLTQREMVGIIVGWNCRRGHAAAGLRPHVARREAHPPEWCI